MDDGDERESREETEGVGSMDGEGAWTRAEDIFDLCFLRDAARSALET